MATQVELSHNEDLVGQLNPLPVILKNSIEISNDVGNPISTNPNISRGTGTIDANTQRVVIVTNQPTITVLASPVLPNNYFLNSLATTNGGLIITGSVGLQSFYASNTGATVAYVKLYNKATAPAVGVDIPEMIIVVPAALAGVPGFRDLSIGFSGFRFNLGLGIAITGGAADNDTTAVTAGQVKVKLSRTS